MAWGCSTASGIGEQHVIDGIITSAKYVRIISNHMVPSAEKLFNVNFIFQQDNEPKHKAGNTKRWFRSKNIDLLDWPSQSLNLNPIENL